jgi:hypothetical protein
VDKHGFVLTGPDLPQDIVRKLDRPPLLLETSLPGIFCVGDVRAGSVKRTATAIGEGSMAVRLVFDRLQSTGLAATAHQSAKEIDANIELMRDGGYRRDSGQDVGAEELCTVTLPKGGQLQARHSYPSFERIPLANPWRTKGLGG